MNFTLLLGTDSAFRRKCDVHFFMEIAGEARSNNTLLCCNKAISHEISFKANAQLAHATSTGGELHLYPNPAPDRTVSGT